MNKERIKNYISEIYSKINNKYLNIEMKLFK